MPRIAKATIVLAAVIPTHKYSCEISGQIHKNDAASEKKTQNTEKKKFLTGCSG